jgi:hypothetical protein
VALAWADPAAAAQRHKRVRAETGPLIMTGSFGPQAATRRARQADLCVPVTVRRRGWSLAGR